MDLAELETMPGVDEEMPVEGVSEETDGMDPEKAMLAKELGFEGDKARALEDFVRLCLAKSDY